MCSSSLLKHTVSKTENPFRKRNSSNHVIIFSEKNFNVVGKMGMLE